MRGLTVVVVGCAVAMVLASPGGAAHKLPLGKRSAAALFVGTWQAVDVTDGSHMRLIVDDSGKGLYTVLYDNYGTICQTPVDAYGPATANKTTLTAVWHGLCLADNTTPFDAGTAHFVLNSDGTLTDDGATGAAPHGWTRVS